MNFTIVIDTREQEPYTFDCQTLRRKLDAADYSVQGCEGLVAVERKSLKDFVHTVIHDLDRFRLELEKLGENQAAVIVVEGCLDRLLRGLEGPALRGVGPQSVLGAALWLQQTHGVPVHWCGSRQGARAFTEGFLRMFVRTRRESSASVAN